MDTQTQTAVSPVSTEKNIGVAYLLWFFLGYLGAHRFYLGDNKAAFWQLGLFIGGVLTFIFVIGGAILFGLGIWVLIDAFLIPGLLRKANGV